MNSKRMVLLNLKANVKNYALYVFALVFSVALYFAFVTLQYDPALDEAEGTVKGAAAIRAASVLLVAIVGVFNLYANNIFLRRRSKEIGLLRLVGMTKGSIFRMLGAEHGVLYFGSVAVGAFAGFAVSKLVLLILLRVTGVPAEAALRFSPPALLQTILVFGALYVFVMLVDYAFIRRQTILSLFRHRGSTESSAKRVSAADAVIGLLGLALIGTGYWVSSKLLTGTFTTTPELFGAMIGILGSVIVGTYFFYKGSVRLIFDRIRRRKDGYLSVRAVLSLSSILFRMKSNAMLLTVITTVSALAVGLLSLSYIAYYSAEKTAVQYVPAHFALTDPEDAAAFLEALDGAGIAARETRIEVVHAYADLTSILGADTIGMNIDAATTTLPVISESAVEGVDLSPEETFFTGYSDMLQKYMQLRPSGDVSLRGRSEEIPLHYSGLKKDYLVSGYFTDGGLPTAVVDDGVFKRLQADLDPSIQREASLYIGVDVEDPDRLTEANALFHELGYHEVDSYYSRTDMSASQKMSVGLTLFIVGFLGLTFLITSGCILYFKQMDESEDERPTYTILRKLGFTRGDLIRGVRTRQLLGFGIPLAVGLAHGYFAVQSGWFLFGAELWTPMLLVMALYTALYSVFGLLSVAHYKKVIRESL